jgi:hypothetical protein
VTLICFPWREKTDNFALEGEDLEMRAKKRRKVKTKKMTWRYY